MADDLGRTRHIRELNDQLRRDMPHGSVRISRAVGQLFSNAQLTAITDMIRSFDDFGPDSEMDERHDRGVIEFEGFEIIWQIETVGRCLEVESDGAESMLTLRIALAHDA
jgi:Protein of unknown function (DUF3768)